MSMASKSKTQQTCKHTSSSSHLCAGQRFTPHIRTLEVRPGRVSKKLGIVYDHNVKGMILNYYDMI